jgi:hypothetical protein
MSELSAVCSSCSEAEHKTATKVNALVWACCAKNKHHGAKVISCAVASSVCHFHSGASSRVRVMQKPSIPAGVFTKQASAKKDKRQIKGADQQATDKGSS